jgi:hypothetical protein
VTDLGVEGKMVERVWERGVDVVVTVEMEEEDTASFTWEES